MRSRRNQISSGGTQDRNVPGMTIVTPCLGDSGYLRDITLRQGMLGMWTRSPCHRWCPGRGTSMNNKGVSNFVVIEVAERDVGPGCGETTDDR